jgi:hypothetical protein
MMREGQDPGEHMKQMKDLQAELNKKMYKSRQRHISTVGMYATAAVRLISPSIPRIGIVKATAFTSRPAC